MSAPVVELLELGRDPWRAVFSFAVSPELEPLLWDERLLVLACSEGVRSEPEVLAAGFVSALAPLGWTHGAEIVSPVPVPRGALASLRRVGSFLQRHYGWPEHDPFHRLETCDDLDLPRHHDALMFSAGIDSAMALIELEERRAVDWLVHLSNFENLDSRTTEEQQQAGLVATRTVADEHGLGWMHLWTNLASIFKHNRFDDRFPEGCSFWLGLEHVHHIATALTVVRPLLGRSHLAGGFSELLSRVGSCAGSAAYVEGYDYPAPIELVHEHEPRQWKVEQILDRAPELLATLRVCYSSGDGTCGECRKCQATALMIVAAGGDLARTSFPPRVVPALVERIAEIRDLPVEGHRFFNQALEGRALSGERQQRWNQLLVLLAVQPPWPQPQRPGAST